MSGAYYNEIDPFAAAWLRELIKAGVIAAGEVDERDIRDVAPDDLRGFTQCHFFAGIGVWSYAARLAGWPDGKPIWTGSCPCQPFSAAGKRAGFSDERHLWPAWHWLIEQCGPRVVFGEQVASSDGLAWFDLVSTDLEASDYSIGPVNLPACGVGAPNLRQRLFFVADAMPAGWSEGWPESGNRSTARCGAAGKLGDSGGIGSRRDTGSLPSEERKSEGLGQIARSSAHELVNASALGDPSRSGRSGRSGERGDDESQLATAQRAGGPVNGFWSNAEWVYCKDGKYRPIEPGSFPLAYGAPARVGRLRGYGNAINAEAAAAVIRAYREVRKFK